MPRANLRILPVLVTLSALFIMPATSFAQSAARPTYTWKTPAKVITFNSITDNPQVGDERQFLLARDFQSNDYLHSLKVRNGQEVVIRAYYDNDVAANYNLKSKNTRLQMVLPTKTIAAQTVYSYISSDNAKPQVVADSVSFTADQPFNLKYEAGSAQIWNNANRGTKLSDGLVTSQGALLGYSKLDGVVRGGAQYSGYVTIKAKVQFAKTSASTKSPGTVSGVPNTGPGDVAGLFIGATAISVIGHSLFSSRRRSQI